MVPWHRTPYLYRISTWLHRAEYMHTVRYTPHVQLQLQRNSPLGSRAPREPGQLGARDPSWPLVTGFFGPEDPVTRVVG